MNIMYSIDFYIPGGWSYSIDIQPYQHEIQQDGSGESHHIEARGMFWVEIQARAGSRKRAVITACRVV